MFLWDCQLDWVGVDCFACLRGYRLFNVAEPTRPPEKIYTKRRRDSRKDKGGFSILGGNIRTWKKRRGVGGSICNTKCKTNGGKVCWMCILVSIGSAKYFAQIWGGGVGAFGHYLTLLGYPYYCFHHTCYFVPQFDTI